MDIYIFLTINIIWTSLLFVYNYQKAFIWGKIQEMVPAITAQIITHPVIPFLVGYIQRQTPTMKRKRKVIEFHYVSNGQKMCIPIALDDDQKDSHTYLLMKGGKEIGRLTLPPKVPLLVQPFHLGCDEILPLETEAL